MDESFDQRMFLWLSPTEKGNLLHGHKRAAEAVAVFIDPRMSEKCPSPCSF